jgi:hypothetical protein
MTYLNADRRKIGRYVQHKLRVSSLTKGLTAEGHFALVAYRQKTATPQLHQTGREMIVYRSAQLARVRANWTLAESDLYQCQHSEYEVSGLPQPEIHLMIILFFSHQIIANNQLPTLFFST